MSRMIIKKKMKKVKTYHRTCRSAMMVSCFAWRLVVLFFVTDHNRYSCIFVKVVMMNMMNWHKWNGKNFHFYLASAAAVVNSSQWIASSPASCKDCSPPPNFMSGLTLTILFMVCCWPHAQKSDEVRLHLYRLERQQPWPVLKWFSRDRDRRGRLNPGCWIVGSGGRVFQLFLLWEEWGDWPGWGWQSETGSWFKDAYRNELLLTFKEE